MSSLKIPENIKNRFFVLLFLLLLRDALFFLYVVTTTLSLFIIPRYFPTFIITTIATVWYKRLRCKSPTTVTSVSRRFNIATDSFWWELPIILWFPNGAVDTVFYFRHVLIRNGAPNRLLLQLCHQKTNATI